MEESNEKIAPPPKKRPMDRRVKIGFVVVVVVAVALVYYSQIRGTSLQGDWLDDFDEATATARAAAPTRVAVLVTSFPVSDTDDRVVKVLNKAKSQKELKDFVCVRLRPAPKADWAKKYGVTKTPTLLLLSADGEKSWKHEGFISESELVTFLTVGTPLRGDWGGDLKKARAEATRLSTNVVVFVSGEPRALDDDRVVKVLSRPAIQAELAKLVLVRLELDKYAPRWAKRHGVTRTPTLLLMSADEASARKHEGTIRESALIPFLTTPGFGPVPKPKP